MKKIKFALKNSVVLAVLIGSFIACDKDFATVGSDIIGDSNFLTPDEIYPVVAFTNPLPPVQTNNLPLNYLGVYKDPLYGMTTANFVTQVSSSLIDPDFGENVQIDSVVLTVPYFSRRVEISDEGETIYELDSVFGNGFIKLEIFENTYFLNTIDPNQEFNTPLRYYSDMTTSNSTINSALLEGTPITVLEDPDDEQDDDILEVFKPSNDGIELWDEEGEVTERLAPALRVKLDTTFWYNKIISLEPGSPELSNANNFNNYFRGLYFKATPIEANGNLMLLNFSASAANVTIYYTRDSSIEDADPVNSTYVLTFAGNRVNFLENQFSLTIPDGDPVMGDEKLYLKGGEGSTAVIDLFQGGTFEDGNSPEFLDFKEKFVETDSEGKFVKSKRLINEASLVFYVAQEDVIGNEPERLYLYDQTNGTPLIDYFLDLTNSVNPNISKANHLGILQREDNEPNGDGIKYKMRITEHINNLLLRDSTNVKLGLAVSLNVNLENALNQYKVKTDENAVVSTVPASSIISPKGTILFGNNTTDETKKLQLEIYYTCIRTDDNCQED